MWRVLRTLTGGGLAVLLLAVALAACGGDGSSTGSTVTSAAGEGKAPSKGLTANSKQDGAEGKSGSKTGGDKSGKSSGGGGESKSNGGSAADFVPKQHSDSGGGAKQYEVKGGDNSVQEFGGEAGDADFKAAADVLHNFLDARAEGNWAAACQYLSKATIESFEKLASAAKQVDDSSCGSILAGLTNPAAKAAMKAEAKKADVGSLRTEGDRSFLIYTVGDSTIFAMPMANEDGAWKVANLTGTPLN